MRYAALLCCLFAACSIALAAPLPLNALDADEKAWFYNRPAASVAEVEADLAFCMSFGRDMTMIRRSTPDDNLLVMSAGAGFPHVYTDDCMISLGYRRFDVEGQNLRTFLRGYSSLSEAERGSLVSAPEPTQGVLARQWDNAVWLGEESLPLESLTSRRVRPKAAPPPTALISATTSSSPQVRSNEALVLISVTRVVESGGTPGRRSEIGDTVLSFSLAGEGDDAAPQSLVLARIPSVRMDNAEADRSLDPVLLAFVVPAGVYYLQSAWVGLPAQTVQFCLGTIATEVRAGEVVHLGNFTVRPGGPRTNGGVRLNLGPPNLRLRVDAPELETMPVHLGVSQEWWSRLRRATWRNDQLASCPVGARVPTYGFSIPDVATR